MRQTLTSITRLGGRLAGTGAIWALIATVGLTGTLGLRADDPKEGAPAAEADPADAKTPDADKEPEPEPTKAESLFAEAQKTMSQRFRNREEATEGIQKVRKLLMSAQKEAGEDEADLKTSIDAALMQSTLPAVALTEDPVEKERLIKGFFEKVESVELTPPTAQMIAMMLRNFDDDPATALPIYEKWQAKFAESESPQLLRLANSLDGQMKRLRLPGTEMEIVGTTAEGAVFDVKQYRGKVVLVDFWATWCGPCRGEHPNVKAMYEKYHDAGFEVVGISLDQELEPLKSYVAEEDVPWVNLYDEDSPGWAHPIAKKYGINAIPAMYLLDEEGKVVHVAARGAALRAELAKRFPDVKDPEPKSEKASEKEASSDDQ